MMKGKVIEGPTEPDNVPVVICSDPISIQCNSCFAWSKYKNEYHTKLPRTWTDDKRGYTCGECNNKRKNK